MNDIYKPSDDTELLLDVVSKYTNTTILEIGIGSGLILQTLASNNNNVVGIDINSKSLSYVSSRLDELDLRKYTDLILGDGPSMVVSNSFDIIIFNPPYLPHDDYTDITTDGGKTGLELTHTWLILSLDLGKPGGCIIFVQSSLSSIDNYIDNLSKSYSVDVVMKKKLFYEELSVVKVIRNK